jgi:hypothetical protein
MSKEAEYRGFAASCLQVAHNTLDTADKARLLAMAEAWVKLAERANRLAERLAPGIPDHPLVAKALE